jgi:hypothetical protein
MDDMRKAAFVSVSRACGFGMLAIVCIMVGLSYQPRAVFKAGGILTLMMTFILILKARLASTQNYRKTEMWLILPENLRPPEDYAQWASAAVLRETYLTFAMWTAGLAIPMWVLAFLFALQSP